MLDFARFKVITFDCYGTLIDWEGGILTAVRPVLAKHGVDVTDREVLETFARVEAKHEDGEFLDYRLVLRLVMAEMSLRFSFDATPVELNCLSDSLKDWKPFHDTLDSLKKLKTRYKLAIISNIDDNLFSATARCLEVPFDWTITAQQARAYKPSLKTFEFALGRIGHPREQILHVAQSVYHDVVPAKAMGLATVWVNRRAGKQGSGATVSASAVPDLEVPDLESLVDVIFE
ncbi:MAG: haloacid dehalogenase type II [Candidatus Latescibacterota bacterium]|nr:MAG: haloacid dehalogenase type II [Candidatus Latescibacterota bacterium]